MLFDSNWCGCEAEIAYTVYARNLPDLEQVEICMAAPQALADGIRSRTPEILDFRKMKHLKGVRCFMLQDSRNETV